MSSLIPPTILSFLLCVAAIYCTAKNVLPSEEDYYFLFKTFVKKYNRSYINDTAEFNHRFIIFKQNVKKVSNMEVFSDGAQFGITKFSDLTEKEFTELYLKGLKGKHPLLKSSQQPPNSTTPMQNIRKLKIPLAMDWRKSKAVTKVKNQGSCGACWAFSCVETMESMCAIMKNISAPELSVQEVIDCTGESLGCRGGDTCSTLQWLQKNNQTVVYESAYPLKDIDESCRPIKKDAPGAQVIESTCDNFVGKEDKMLLHLAQNGPLVAAVDASTWSNYQKGIIRYHCEATNNHAVQIVGYNISGEVPYYIVRNSWGNDFGIAGYLHIAVGSNLCGLAQEISTLQIKIV
ncbi:cathepsin O [Octopus bimaculoides]|uniref:Cathepsin O n=1 Tax=Octopus bimaculoides TaxID=37653 RepID=A0A0L8FUN9_OCTBM|nr:cathepsin O [Octopus bimaculoides]|eukprot:XP_014786761.1 PREDICTED: cathepsin O-like [Octopus bimaculoides]